MQWPYYGKLCHPMVIVKQKYFKNEKEAAEQLSKWIYDNIKPACLNIEIDAVHLDFYTMDWWRQNKDLVNEQLRHKNKAVFDLQVLDLETMEVTTVA